jgi:hypothetical protein
VATLEQLLEIVEQLTPLFTRPRQGKRFRPGPAQIAYLTLLALRRRGVALPDDPTWQEFSREVVAEFRADALRIAMMLVTEYPRVRKLLRELDGKGLAEALQLLHTWMLKTPLFQVPALPGQAHLAGVRRKVQAQWQQRWEVLLEAVWAERGYLIHSNVLQHIMLPPVALARAPKKRALEALRERLRQDRLRGWAPAPETFLFQEPFDQWIVRPLLRGETLMGICQALADQAAALTQMIHQETLQAALDAGISESPASDLLVPVGELYRRLPKARRRVLPVPPNGTVTARTIFEFTVMGWRQAHPTARAATVTEDQPGLEPADFQDLVPRAMATMVFQLWDASAELRALPPDSPAFWACLRRCAVPESLWNRYQKLLDPHHPLPVLANPPRLEAWEEALRASHKRITTRLAASPVPGEPLTSRVLLNRAYLYDRPFLAWLREALPSRMPDFGVVLAYCQALAEAQGIWPGEATFGAPRSAEEAGRVIAWYTKLTLEALLSRGALAQLGVRPERSPFFLRDLPQRDDGGLTLWIGQPMPPAALELASVVAPIIAHFLYLQACDPLGFLPFDLQDDKHAAWGKMKRLLFARARSMGYDQSEAEAEVERVVAVVCEQLGRLLLPQSITPELLQGGKSLLVKHGLAVDNYKSTLYNLNATYKFVGTLQSYILQCLRPSEHGPPVLSFEEMLARGGEEQMQSLFGSDAPDVESEVLRREAVPPLVAQAEARYADALAWARPELLRLMLTDDLAASLPLPDDLRARLMSRQRLVLAHGLMERASGRQFVQQRMQQGDLLALEVQRLAAMDLPDDDSLFNSGQMIPRALDWARPAEVMVLLAQLLMHRKVREMPALREAVAVLFDLRWSLESSAQPSGYYLARLERVGPGAMVPALREVSVRALEALGGLASRERKAVVLRLFRLADVRLTLALLERTGWVAPRWLIADAEPPGSLAEHEADEVLDVYRTIGDRFDLPDAPGWRGPIRFLLTEQLTEPVSPQIFQEGRARWHSALATSVDPLDRAAAGRVAEWMGIGPWDEPWLRPRTKDQGYAAGYLFQTLLAAPPAMLRVRFQQARVLTTDAEHALEWPELLGLAGSLSPQLPLALEDPVFLHRLAWRLFELVRVRLDPVTARSMRFPSTLPGEMCASLIEVRRRLAAFFLALGQLPNEQVRRVVLAALSAAQGRPERFSAWLAGAVIDEQTSQEISRIVHLAHHRIVLDAAQVPELFAQARQDGDLEEAWREVCKG